MIQKIIGAILGCLILISANAQSSTIEEVLIEVETNNKELRSLLAYGESRKLALKASNTLPNPEFGTYYMPFGDHSTGDYLEFEISQTIEFPTVYRERKELHGQLSEAHMLTYRVKRQEVLAGAKRICVELIHVNRLLNLEQSRLQQARQVYDQVQEMFEREQVGILELNKARVAWLQEQFRVGERRNDAERLLMGLEGLNGGKPVVFAESEFTASPEVMTQDSLWQEKLTNDPHFAHLRQQELIAEKRVRLTRAQNLSDLSLGYNHQGFSGEYYSGFYAGVRIPLWSNRQKVSAAQASLHYQEELTASAVIELRTQFQQLYKEYTFRLTQLREYQSTLSDLQSEDLLLQAYRLGEISFLEYYRELQFYRQAYDAMLEMEYQLHRLQISILKHQL